MEQSNINIRTLGENIQKGLQSERIFEKIQWSLSVVFVVLLPCWIAIQTIHVSTQIILDNNTLSIAFLALFFISLILLHLLRVYVIRGISQILQLNDTISTIDIRAIDMTDTLSGFDFIQKNINTLLLWKKTVWLALFYRENGGKYIQKDIIQFLGQEIGYILELSSNLRSDLFGHIEHEQDALTEAKSEISTNLQGSTALIQVSELQKTRLDRQIEQFEELQRVLVKV